jgi:hypothetical protein
MALAPLQQLCCVTKVHNPTATRFQTTSFPFEKGRIIMQRPLSSSMMRISTTVAFPWILLLLWPITSSRAACQVEVTGGVEIRFNETAQLDECIIVLRDITIQLDGTDLQPPQYACVKEQFAGGNETEYGPFALSTVAFAPDVLPFEGSILSFEYVIYPAFDATSCGDDNAAVCNATAMVDVDVFGCFLKAATPSPTLPPATPRPSPPPFVMSMVTVNPTPVSNVVVTGGGVMATRMPSILPFILDAPTDSPVPKSDMAVVLKDPLKPPVSPSPTFLPGFSPTTGIILPPAPASSSSAIQSGESMATAAAALGMPVGMTRTAVATAAVTGLYLLLGG